MLNVAQRGAVRNAALGRQLESVSVAQQGASSSGMSLSGVLSGMGGAMVAVGTAAAAAASAIASIGMAGARSAVELGGFQESTMVSMRTMLGSSGAAEQEFDRAVQIARSTPFDTRAVVTMRRQLVGAGFRDSRERDVMSGVIADLSAMNPEDSSIMGRVTTAVAQMRSAGRLRTEELQQLFEAGLNRDAMFAELAPLLHVRGTGEAANRRIQAMIESGRVNNNIGSAALSRAVMRMTGTNAVGQFATNQGATIPGLLSTLGSAIPELLMGRTRGGKGEKGTRLFESAGFQAFKGFLQTVIGLLSSTSKTGQRLQAIMRGVIDDVFGLFSSISNAGGGTKDQKGPEVIFNKMLDALESVISAVKTLFEWGKAYAGGYFSVMGPMFQKLADAAGQLFAQLSGGGSTSTVDVLRVIGQVIGWIVARMVSMIVTLIQGITLLVQCGQFMWTRVWKPVLSWIGEKIDFLRTKLASLWDALPQPVRDLLSSAFNIEAGANPFRGANDVVGVRPGEPAVQPLVSQPNVQVNIHAQSPEGVTPEQMGTVGGGAVANATHIAAQRVGRRSP